MPYTERHFQRTEKLLQKTFLMDYLLQRMTSIETVQAQEDLSDGPSVNKKRKF